MSTSTELSSVPMVRLKAFVQNVGHFAWDDSDRVETIVKNLCGSLEREPDLLMRAIREGVPAALRRAFERGQDQPSEYNVALVAKHLSKRIVLEPDESYWAVRTIAVAIGYAPLPPPGALRAAKAIRAEPPPGYSYQTRQPGPDFSLGHQSTEIEKRQRAAAESDAIELPGPTAEQSG